MHNTRRCSIWRIAIAIVTCSGVFGLGGASASAALLVTGLVSGNQTLPIPGNQAWAGQMGDDFTTTDALTITRIGVFDDNGNGTTKSLFWQLFEVSTGSLVAQFEVPATGPRVPAGNSIVDNYVFKTVTPIHLAANTTYSAVAYGFDNANKNFNTNFSLNTLDVVFSNVGLNALGGRYGNAGNLTGLPMVDVGMTPSAKPYNFGAATFEYSVPEPASLLVWSLVTGLVIGVVVARTQRSQAASATS